jgi:rubrerythrin
VVEEPRSGVSKPPPREEYRRSVTDGIIRIPEPVGDAACWLGRVCPECGGLDESPHPAEVCPRCGAEMPEAEG